MGGNDGWSGRLLTADPLAAEEPPGQKQKAACARQAFKQQGLRQGIPGRQQCGHGGGHKGQRRAAAAPACPGACQQPRKAQPGSENSAARTGTQVRCQAQPQPHGSAGYRTPFISGVGQQDAQQSPADRQSQNFQILQGQQ